MHNVLAATIFHHLLIFNCISGECMIRVQHRDGSKHWMEIVIFLAGACISRSDMNDVISGFSTSVPDHILFRLTFTRTPRYLLRTSVKTDYGSHPP